MSNVGKQLLFFIKRSKSKRCVFIGYLRQKCFLSKTVESRGRVVQNLGRGFWSFPFHLEAMPSTNPAAAAAVIAIMVAINRFKILPFPPPPQQYQIQKSFLPVISRVSQGPSSFPLGPIPFLFYIIFKQTCSRRRSQWPPSPPPSTAACGTWAAARCGQSTRPCPPRWAPATTRSCRQCSPTRACSAGRAAAPAAGTPRTCWATSGWMPRGGLGACGRFLGKGNVSYACLLALALALVRVLVGGRRSGSMGDIRTGWYGPLAQEADQRLPLVQKDLGSSHCEDGGVW
jgi:hypothetical protein